jgi:hypothetical protein
MQKDFIAANEVTSLHRTTDILSACFHFSFNKITTGVLPSTGRPRKKTHVQVFNMDVCGDNYHLCRDFSM